MIFSLPLLPFFRSPFSKGKHHPRKEGEGPVRRDWSTLASCARREAVEKSIVVATQFSSDEVP